MATSNNLKNTLRRMAPYVRCNHVCGATTSRDSRRRSCSASSNMFRFSRGFDVLWKGPGGDTKCNAVELPWKEHCLESGTTDNARKASQAQRRA